MLAGGYALRRADGRPAVTLAGMGAVMPEVLEAADRLATRPGSRPTCSA